MPFKDISYLELLWPFSSAERNHLCNFSKGHNENNSVNLFLILASATTLQPIFLRTTLTNWPWNCPTGYADDVVHRVLLYIADACLSPSPQSRKRRVWIGAGLDRLLQ